MTYSKTFKVGDRVRLVKTNNHIENGSTGTIFKVDARAAVVGDPLLYIRWDDEKYNYDSSGRINSIGVFDFRFVKIEEGVKINPLMDDFALNSLLRETIRKSISDVLETQEQEYSGITIQIDLFKKEKSKARVPPPAIYVRHLKEGHGCTVGSKS